MWPTLESQADDIRTLKLLVQTIDRWVESNEHGEFYKPDLTRNEKLGDCIYIIDHIIETACVNENDVEADKMQREFWLELSVVLVRIKNAQTIELLLSKPVEKVIDMLEDRLIDKTLAQFVDFKEVHRAAAIARWVQFLEGVVKNFTSPSRVSPPLTFADHPHYMSPLFQGGA